MKKKYHYGQRGESRRYSAAGMSTIGTLALTLLLHGLGAQLAAGWIRRPEEETSRELVERFLSPLLP